MQSTRAKHLIVPGLAKAGTTFLYDNLSRDAAHFNVPIRKELNFFASQNTGSLARYLKLFPKASENKFYLDCSPVYLESGRPIANNISACLEGRDVWFIVAVRNPVEALISHYYHDLKSNIGRMRRLKEFDTFSIWDPKILQKYVKKRSEEIKRLRTVGYDKILGMHQKDLFKSDASGVIGNFLSIELQPFQTQKVSNPGGWLPYYIYGGKSGSFVEYDGALYEIPAKALVLVSNARSEIKFNASEDFAHHALTLQSTFSRRITVDKSYFTPAIDEYHALCDSLGLIPDQLDLPDIIDFVPTTPRINEALAKQLKRISA